MYRPPPTVRSPVLSTTIPKLLQRKPHLGARYNLIAIGHLQGTVAFHVLMLVLSLAPSWLAMYTIHVGVSYRRKSDTENKSGNDRVVASDPPHLQIPARDLRSFLARKAEPAENERVRELEVELEQCRSALQACGGAGPEAASTGGVLPADGQLESFVAPHRNMSAPEKRELTLNFYQASGRAADHEGCG